MRQQRRLARLTQAKPDAGVQVPKTAVGGKADHATAAQSNRRGDDGVA